MNLIHISTVANGFVALFLIHHSATFSFSSQAIAANADNQIHIRKDILGLDERNRYLQIHYSYHYKQIEIIALQTCINCRACPWWKRS